MIPKTSDKFKMVVKRLEDVGIPQLAEKYADLEKVLIEHKVRVLLREV